MQEDKLSDQGSEERLTNQFVEPMVDETIVNYREMFGLPTGEGTDSLNVIAIHAEA